MDATADNPAEIAALAYAGGSPSQQLGITETAGVGGMFDWFQDAINDVRDTFSDFGDWFQRNVIDTIVRPLGQVLAEVVEYTLPMIGEIVGTVFGVSGLGRMVGDILAGTTGALLRNESSISSALEKSLKTGLQNLILATFMPMGATAKQLMGSAGELIGMGPLVQGMKGMPYGGEIGRIVRQVETLGASPAAIAGELNTSLDTMLRDSNFLTSVASAVPGIGGEAANVLRSIQSHAAFGLDAFGDPERVALIAMQNVIGQSQRLSGEAIADMTGMSTELEQVIEAITVPRTAGVGSSAIVERVLRPAFDVVVQEINSGAAAVVDQVTTTGQQLAAGAEQEIGEVAYELMNRSLTPAQRALQTVTAYALATEQDAGRAGRLAAVAVDLVEGNVPVRLTPRISVNLDGFQRANTNGMPAADRARAQLAYIESIMPALSSTPLEEIELFAITQSGSDGKIVATPALTITGRLTFLLPPSNRAAALATLTPDTLLEWTDGQPARLGWIASRLQQLADQGPWPRIGLSNGTTQLPRLDGVGGYTTAAEIALTANPADTNQPRDLPEPLSLDLPGAAPAGSVYGRAAPDANGNIPGTVPHAGFPPVVRIKPTDRFLDPRIDPAELATAPFGGSITAAQIAASPLLVQADPILRPYITGNNEAARDQATRYNQRQMPSAHWVEHVLAEGGEVFRVYDAAEQAQVWVSQTRFAQLQAENAARSAAAAQQREAEQAALLAAQVNPEALPADGMFTVVAPQAFATQFPDPLTGAQVAELYPETLPLGVILDGPPGPTAVQQAGSHLYNARQVAQGVALWLDGWRPYPPANSGISDVEIEGPNPTLLSIQNDNALGFAIAGAAAVVIWLAGRKK